MDGGVGAGPRARARSEGEGLEARGDGARQGTLSRRLEATVGEGQGARDAGRSAGDGGPYQGGIRVGRVGRPRPTAAGAIQRVNFGAARGGKALAGR